MWHFSIGGAKSVLDMGTGGQKSFSTYSQCYHYSFCPRGGANSIANFDGGGHDRICPPGSATECHTGMVTQQFVYGHFVYDTSSTDISSTTVYQRTCTSQL